MFDSDFLNSRQISKLADEYVPGDQSWKREDVIPVPREEPTQSGGGSYDVQSTKSLHQIRLEKAIDRRKKVGALAAKGMTCNEIALELGVLDHCIRADAKKLGIELRKVVSGRPKAGKSK